MVVFSPRDTVRGPIEGASVLGEVDQPLLLSDQPRLTIGPMRLTFGVPRTGAVGDVGRGVEDSLMNRVLALANLKDIPVVCLRAADGSFLEWDDAARATKGEARSRCGANATALRGEIWLARDDPRAGRYEGNLIRIPVKLWTYDFSHCPTPVFLCGAGLALDFECEVRIRSADHTVQCVMVRRSHWISELASQTVWLLRDRRNSR
jgi:hypothetical protein